MNALPTLMKDCLPSSLLTALDPDKAHPKIHQEHKDSIILLPPQHEGMLAFLFGRLFREPLQYGAYRGSGYFWRTSFGKIPNHRTCCRLQAIWSGKASSLSPEDHMSIGYRS